MPVCMVEPCFLIEASVGAALTAVDKSAGTAGRTIDCIGHTDETDVVVVVIAFIVANDVTVLVTGARHVGRCCGAGPRRGEMHLSLTPLCTVADIDEEKERALSL